MPELDALANQNINFSHHNQIGGSFTLEGTQWTIALMVGQSKEVSAVSTI